MRIDVTRDDIRLGKRGRCNTCPVARAIRRDLGKGIEVFVYGSQVSIGGRVFELTRGVSDFIERFDHDGRRGLKPFSFTLPIKAKPRKAAKR